ncbi:MAG: MAPEG family protein [Myxococcales bacterium]|nr:MAPEG family protein [Myxococcales bacterium]MBL0196388.1 MAPEG family protein [Myxococcales bacterium]HQY60946.1 MAPEG family protein [Polyangiaceae bacterium]
MAIPTVTALYGALNALLNIALANQVSSGRRRERIGVGTGESRDLLLAVRIHANNAEFVPLALVMLLLAELCGGGSLGLHVAGGALLVSRVAHALGMPRPAPNALRFFGTAGTWGMIVGMSCWVLWLRTRG